MRIGLVGTGAMGSALGAGWLAGGSEVVTCPAGRSARSEALAAAAGVAAVASFDEVVDSDVVVSVVPPAAALAVARDIVVAARRTGARPVVVDLNAVAPATVRRIGTALAEGGLPLIDGAISGPPPKAGARTIVYLNGPVERLRELPSPWLELVEVAGPLGSASAVKMCTASLYKGTKALVMHALLTAERHGVLEHVLADTSRAWPQEVPRWPHDIALAAAKAGRFVGEMHEIARTQADAGLPREMFDGIAAAFARAAATPLGRRDPEQVAPAEPVDRILAGLAGRPRRAPDAVLVDFSGTLFHIESAEHALLAALGPDWVHRAPELVRLGAINGSGPPDDLPAELEQLWATRDLSPQGHRAAYSDAAMRAGLDAAQAARLYARGLAPEAWHPYVDSVVTLRRLRELRVPVAVVSNIGWDPRPVFERYGVDGDIDVLVLSDERGVQKPDPEIFRIACAELSVEPQRCVMVGDNPTADGGSVALGIPFRKVPADPARRRRDTLLRTVFDGSPDGATAQVRAAP